jgi:hypothetical protein
MAVLSGWEELIKQAEALEVDGLSLEVTFADTETLKYALVALVVYNSRHDTNKYPWGFTLDITNSTTLHISKVSLNK